LIRYADMKTHHPVLNEQLAEFFQGLYSSSLLGLAAFKAMIGDIDDHYNKFTRVNKTKCRSCGISDILGPDHSHRDAYDHYLPKGTYPFNSINFRNLVPACHHCNSSYKGTKDPAFTPKDALGAQARRKVFHPFSKQPYRITVQVTLGHADYEKLIPTDIVLSFGPPELAEQIDTWKDLYGIEERYREKLRSEDGKDWLVKAMDEWPLRQKLDGTADEAIEAYLRAVSRHARTSPYANANFLKHSFLEACRLVGVFDRSVQTTGL
jgi:hypothetical protein